MWYVLSSSDRSKVFVEGAGVVTAAQWESLVSRLSKKLRVVIPPPDNLTVYAVRGLENDLRKIGMVIDDHEPDTGPGEQEDSTASDDLVFLHNKPDTSDTVTTQTPEPASQEQAETEQPDPASSPDAAVKNPIRFSPSR
ncbi:TPA: hypothetical protein N2G38_005493 [Salmonella enterica]|nr:hypothetical protein [Salmonella enterica]